MYQFPHWNYPVIVFIHPTLAIGIKIYRAQKKARDSFPPLFGSYLYHIASAPLRLILLPPPIPIPAPKSLSFAISARNRWLQIRLASWSYTLLSFQLKFYQTLDVPLNHSGIHQGVSIPEMSKQPPQSFSAPSNTILSISSQDLRLVQK